MCEEVSRFLVTRQLDRIKHITNALFSTKKL